MITLFKKYRIVEYFIYVSLLLKLSILCLEGVKLSDHIRKTKIYKNYNLYFHQSYLSSIFMISTSIILIYLMNPFYSIKYYISYDTKFLLFVYAAFVLSDHINYDPQFNALIRIKNMLLRFFK